MPLHLVHIAALMLAAQSLILTGVFFISGQIFPGLLGGFYGKTSEISRTVMASALIFPFGNFLTGYAMSHFSPALVTPVMAASAILMQIAFTIAVIGYKPPLWIIPATLLTMAGCVWVSLLLSKSA